MKAIRLLPLLVFVATTLGPERAPADIPLVSVPEAQPLVAQVRRLVEALELVGAPLPEEQKKSLDAAMAERNDPLAVTKIQSVLDPHVLFSVTINPEMRVKVSNGDARPELVETGWRPFLVKVANESGTTAQLRASSPNAGRLHGAPASEVRERWLDIEMFNKSPMAAGLSGLGLEYRIILLYSRDSGRREGRIAFNVGQGTQDLGFRGEANVLFDCLAARPVTLGILDENGKPTTASLVVTDSRGHFFPAQSKRLAPDFSFHPQIYRADGEVLRLPEGKYTVLFKRGPESVELKRELNVGADGAKWDFQVARWIDPSKFGWWSGDHHIHAAGCAHYEKPTEGVLADDMIRHVLGEDLKVGCNLTWGPCFDYQKQFFTGKDDKASQFPYLLHYDVEVSQFGSHESGHLCLLRLREQIYPGGDSKNHWPKLGLNTLKWAKKQGALCGPAHSGWGLEAKSSELPNFTVPPFDGIGANEYIVDVTHEVEGPEGKPVPAVDFISTVDTPYPWELNIWYHTLNAGFRTRISGETDFPCIYGDRVGLGRSYVKLDGPLNYMDWCEQIRAGRNYVSDGLGHILDFRVDNIEMGVEGSELKLDSPKKVKIHARVAARLDETPHPEIKQRSVGDKPYWHLERARIDGTRMVPVELIHNGYSVATTNIMADGVMRDVEFSIDVPRSGWLALRILPSSHTNPVFVTVGGKPIRTSRRSVDWCLKGVDQCWKNKERFMKGEEIAQAKAAYQHAREVYRKRITECEVE